MYIEKISLERAQKLKGRDSVTILDLSPSNIKEYPGGGSWRENFNLLRKKFPSINISNLTRFILPEYLIEVKEETFNEDLPCITWRYFYGVSSERFRSMLASNKLEYVYILTNASLPGIVKIGMTAHTVDKRVKQLNKTATLVEWEVRYSVAFREGYAYKVEQAVHKELASCRVYSNKGNKREFFYLTPEEALERVRTIGEGFLAEN